MAEPGFYRCKKCSRAWSRMESKWHGNPPPVCPSCGAGREDQGLDEVREAEYMGQVYKPIAAMLLGSAGHTAVLQDQKPVKLREQILAIARAYNEAWAMNRPLPQMVQVLAYQAFIYEWPESADTRAIRRAAKLLDGPFGVVSADEPGVD